MSVRWHDLCYQSGDDESGWHACSFWAGAKSLFDLDSHFDLPGGHIYFDSKEGTDANLDVDDTDSYGPETVTISKKHFGESYIYAVQDYSNKGLPNSNYLSASKAKVFVYVGAPWYVVIVSLQENEGTSGPCLNSIQRRVWRYQLCYQRQF